MALRISLRRPTAVMSHRGIKIAAARGNTDRSIDPPIGRHSFYHSPPSIGVHVLYVRVRAFVRMYALDPSIHPSIRPSPSVLRPYLRPASLAVSVARAGDEPAARRSDRRRVQLPSMDLSIPCSQLLLLGTPGYVG